MHIEWRETMSFQEYGLQEELLKALQLLSYTTPTKIQELTIPEAMQKKDLWVQSQTGSGKTAAFGLPICQTCDWLVNHPQVLVLVPTRELAIQVAEEIKSLGRFKRLHVLPIFGRVSIEHQELALKQKTHIIVGTPGRVRDLINRGTLQFDELTTLVIDEADEMFFIGLRQQVEDILSLLPTNRQTMLFSATLSDDIRNLTKQYMKEPVEISIDQETITAKEITQYACEVAQEEKMSVLLSLTQVHNPDSCIIFANTQTMVDAIEHQLLIHSYPAKKLHGGMQQKERLAVMSQFKSGAFRYLIATDVAARGIDIDGIELIINYDISRGRQNYVHRIGRCGRAGKQGVAITLYTNKEANAMNEIIAYTEATITQLNSTELEVSSQMKDIFQEKLATKPVLKEKKNKALNQSIQKLCIRAGKKDKIRTCEIVATICSIEGVTAEDIGVIQILPTVTQVEILNNKGALVLSNIRNKTIKGKVRKVSHSHS
jgi:superfamily II DNA/RNA helicase